MHKHTGLITQFQHAKVTANKQSCQNVSKQSASLLFVG